MTKIYRYSPIFEAGPNGRSLMAKLPDGGLELCDIDGVRYVSIPDSAIIPEQYQDISLELMSPLPDALKEEIKTNSRPCFLISERMQEMIRAKYTAEDEMYFARIGTGKALGVYEFQSGEESALLDYGNFVESVRQWGRDERAKIGL